MKIQFLLLSDGPSHNLLGLTPVKGLKELGVETDYIFPRRGINNRINEPDYVFILKPNEKDEELIKSFKKSKIVLIINDEGKPKNLIPYIDFYVSPSIGWQERHSPCYLIKEEFGYYTTRKHVSDSFKIVTTGFKENLVSYLSPIIDIILKKYKDFTIVSNFTIEEMDVKSKKLPNYGVEIIDGCEINKWSVQIANEKFGLNYISGEFNKYTPHRTYECGLMLDYIEHSYNPFQDLQKMSSMIEKGGTLFIKTFLEELDIERTMEAPVGHAYHFYGDVLKKMIIDVGFDICYWQEEGVQIIIIGKKR